MSVHITSGKTWQQAGAELGIGSPTFLADGRVTFRVNLPRGSEFGPGMVWLVSNETPEQFIARLRSSFQYKRVIRLAAEADPKDISPVTPDLTPTAPVAPTAPTAPPPFAPPDSVPPGGEVDGPMGDLGVDHILLPLPPIVDFERPRPIGPPESLKVEPDLNELIRRVPKEAWWVAAGLAALLILK